ncbi:DUF6505 family protein [Geminicoccaceae bacterium 1502E]|nr:DUF6505 family protein [Geminicoccaceae bacterium 1502E]
MSRLLRTIRFDASDQRVFPLAAEAGEWAVPGGFAFAGADEEQLDGKLLQAWRCGFLGLGSFGWSTFARVATIDALTRRQLVERLARHLLERYGAPDLQAAASAAEEEIGFAESLCDLPPDSVLRLSRTRNAQGQLKESFAVVRVPGGLRHDKVWEGIEQDGEEC